MQIACAKNSNWQEQLQSEILQDEEEATQSLLT
jgi:hypothetical protein